MSAPQAVCLSEVMYHPVAEDAFDDHHEFVELHNLGGEPVDLTGYRLSGGIDFQFPAGSSISAGGFLVVAKDRLALLSLGYPGLGEAQVLGDFMGDLGNGGDTVTLLTPGATIADSVSYSDGFPWPVGADALGAGQDWLPPSWGVQASHQYRGMSLERVSCLSPANDPGNWSASVLDGATPGLPNGATGPLPLPVVESLTVQSLAGAPVVGPDQPALLSVRFVHPESMANPAIEYFADDVSVEGDATQTAPLAGAGADYSIQLPGAAGGTIVRYRVLVDTGAGPQVVSPRPNDPYSWHSYFVEPTSVSATRQYHLFIAPQNWTELWDNIEPGRAEGCNVNNNWQSRVPAVFAYQGKAYDVAVRYQGSRWNRFLGPEMNGRFVNGPTRPNPLLALSWRVGFPRYARFEDRGVVLLNKLVQGCPGYTTLVGFELFRQAGIPAPSARYARLNINGQYYHYMLELERVDDDLLEKYHTAQGLGEPLGHLFKSTGFTGDEGPWGWGDGRLLEPSCGFTALDRYTYTYSRETHAWAGHASLVALIEGLHQARAAGDAALRSYLEVTFDMNEVLNYLSVMNFLAPFDDMFQNYFLYQRRSDSKWQILPWDLDLTLGGFQGAQTSLYVGEEGDSDNREGWFSYFKDSFFQVYRSEYLARLGQLSASILAESAINALLDQARAQANPTEADQAPAGSACDFDQALSDMKAFVHDRHLYLASQL